jgi:hypothetical protein
MYPETMATGRHFAILAAFLLPTFPVKAAPAAMSEAMNKEQRQGAVFLDSLSIPCPGEVFAALNKVCRPNWATLVTPATAPVSGDRAQLALAIGVLATDGYIAVEAQDGQQVKNVGREIMAMAKALGVSQSLLGRGHSLVEFADTGAWEALSDELAATEEEVKATMAGQKDRDLVLLTSSAAWLRGLETATGVVLADDSMRGAAVICLPELASRLSSDLATLPPRLGGNPRVVAVREALAKASGLLSPQNPTPEQQKKNLREIHDACATAVRVIMASAKVTASPSPSAEAPPAR